MDLQQPGADGKKLIILARMLAECRDDLTCDMAETYGVLEMRTQ